MFIFGGVYFSHHFNPPFPTISANWEVKGTTQLVDAADFTRQLSLLHMFQPNEPFEQHNYITYKVWRYISPKKEPKFPEKFSPRLVLPTFYREKTMWKKSGFIRYVIFLSTSNCSGQTSVISYPEWRAFFWVWDTLTRAPFGVTSAEVVIICTNCCETKTSKIQPEFMGISRISPGATGFVER